MVIAILVLFAVALLVSLLAGGLGNVDVLGRDDPLGDRDGKTDVLACFPTGESHEVDQLLERTLSEPDGSGGFELREGVGGWSFSAVAFDTDRTGTVVRIDLLGMSATGREELVQSLRAFPDSVILLDAQPDACLENLPPRWDQGASLGPWGRATAA